VTGSVVSANAVARRRGRSAAGGIYESFNETDLSQDLIATGDENDYGLLDNR